MHVDDFDQLDALPKQRWHWYVISCLSQGPMRFSSLVKAIRQTEPNASDGILTRSLRQLAESGVVHRQPCEEATHVWALTAQGTAQARHLQTIIDALRNLRESDDAVDEAPSPEDSTGRDGEQRGNENGPQPLDDPDQPLP